MLLDRVPRCCILSALGDFTQCLLSLALHGILQEQIGTRIKGIGWNSPAHVWFIGKGLKTICDLVTSGRLRG